MTDGCPAGGTRKVIRPADSDGPAVERIGDTWHVRSVDLARKVLRERDGTAQAGFMAEAQGHQNIRPPVLYMDGDAHRDQRSKVARYFAPRTVDRRYRDLMTNRADGLIAEAVAADRFDLDDLALRYSVEVASAVIGLTNSSIEGMAKRLGRLFSLDPIAPGEPVGSRWAVIARSLKPLPSMLSFYLRDVRPAIRVRRRTPDEDVISHLLNEGYSDGEILTECITYGAAGMVTTREYISMCSWHLLTAPELRARYLASDEAERYAILNEILRLEPIVGHLYRRVTQDFTVSSEEQDHEFRAGDLIDFDIRQANADESVVGANPLQICPGRELPRGVGPEVLSFGDGAHKCPGNSLAIQEADTFVSRLMALELEVVNEPLIGWDEVISGYSLRNFSLAVRVS